jgi:plasmid stabilization system protein ParE
MAYLVSLASSATRDLREILQWVVDNELLWGPDWFRGLEDSIGSLCNYPILGIPDPELVNKGREVRHSLYGERPNTYKIYYTVLDEAVVVLRVWLGARRPPTKRDVWKT